MLGSSGQEGGEFAVGASVALVERPAGGFGQVHRQVQQVRWDPGLTIGLGQVDELVHDADDTAVRRLGQADLVRLGYLRLHELAGCPLSGQNAGHAGDEPLEQVRRGR
jgi:hypothetical protein